MPYLYLLINLGAVSIPFIYSFHRKIGFHRQFSAAFAAIGLTAAYFIAWDMYFTQLRVWGFNGRYVMGLYLFNLPVEEILFFICIPFACLFTYFCLSRFYVFRWKKQTLDRFTFIIATLLLAVGVMYAGRVYTSVTFISTALLVVLFRFGFKADWMGRLLSIYVVLLIPFFIVNGLLTGTGPGEPVVWYNDAENLGLRLLTIPVEDVVYGFEMVMLNVFFFERIRSDNPGFLKE